MIRTRSLAPSSFLLLPWLCIALLAGANAYADPFDGADGPDPPGRVARVNLLEGDGALELAGTDTWVNDLQNRPLTGGDKLWIDSGARAELHIGSTALRLGARTALQLIVVDDRTIRLRLTAGALSIRVRDLDADDSLAIETPAGDLALLEPGGYRLNVDDRTERTRLDVWSGRAEARGPEGARELRTDESAELVGGDDPYMELAAAGGTDDLDLWSEDRDRREEQSRAARFVSRDVVGYEALDGYGDWISDPIYGSVWVPQVVASDWAPFRFGYWTWIGPWGWTWIDDAPWGFAPCHYGRWVRVRHGWGWVPGPAHEHRPVFAPALVAWVGTAPGRHLEPGREGRIGWVPLGYNEVYRPPFRASHGYLQAANLSNTHLERRDLDRDLDGGGRREDRRPDRRPERQFVHQAPEAGAYTSVSRENFLSAQPVGRNRLPPHASDLRRAPIGTGNMSERPIERSFGRPPPADRPVAPPDRSVFERPTRAPEDLRMHPQRPVDNAPRGYPGAGAGAGDARRSMPESSFGRPARETISQPQPLPQPQIQAQPQPQPEFRAQRPPQLQRQFRPQPPPQSQMEPQRESQRPPMPMRALPPAPAPAVPAASSPVPRVPPAAAPAPAAHERPAPAQTPEGRGERRPERNRE